MELGKVRSAPQPRPGPRPPQSGPSSANRTTYGRPRRPFTPAQFAKHIRNVARKQGKARKRYLRYKKLRPCVLPLTFFLPLCILLLERYLGYKFKLDDFQEAYNKQLGIDPWKIVPLPSERIGEVPDLRNLTFTSHQLVCPPGQRRMMNVHNPQYQNYPSRKIPNILHQTSATRCQTRNFDTATVRWAFRKWSFYFHDDDAMDRLLQQKFPEFPHLQQVAEHCLNSRALKLGLWRFLVMWVFGGLYTNMNTYPDHFNKSIILPEDDGLFFREPNSVGVGPLSTKVLAVSPRHPLMYYAVHRYLEEVMHVRNADSERPEIISVSEILSEATRDFVKGTKTNPEQDIGILVGMHGRSFRIIGRVGGPEEYFTPIFQTEGGLKAELEKMGMKPVGKPAMTNACFKKLWPG